MTATRGDILHAASHPFAQLQSEGTKVQAEIAAVQSKTLRVQSKWALLQLCASTDGGLFRAPSALAPLIWDIPRGVARCDF